jgi:very-short-patch-repair endonuclease
MRREPTRAERILWRALRNKQAGAKFIRQHPIGPYIADFFCFEARLVIEVDGDQHALDDGLRHDAARDAYLRLQGMTVKRYSNHDVLTNIQGVMNEILDMLHSRQ